MRRLPASLVALALSIAPPMATAATKQRTTEVVARWAGGHLAVGGQLRLRYEALQPRGFGTMPEGRPEGALFSRNLLSVDARLMPGLSLFVQLGGYYALGTNEKRAPPDVDLADVAQLFVEVATSTRELRLTSRVGRQEMPLGSTRWVSVRDGTNMRRVFDLVHLTVGSRAERPFELDAFLGSLPRAQRGAFDDGPSSRERFWGVYATLGLLPSKLLSADAFYLGRARAQARYSALSGDEVRHTLGLRLFGETPRGFELVAHALLQTGSLAGSRVRAWALAGALWQRLPGALHAFRLGLRGDALSGDHSPGDGTVATFDPLFPNQAFFSALPVVYPTNLYDLHPMLSAKAGAFAFAFGCVFFWRQAVADAIYRAPGVPTRQAEATRERFTGAQPSLSLSYAASQRLTVETEYSRFIAGPGFRGGGGVDYFTTWATFDF
jgi:hypothetical protein